MYSGVHDPSEVVGAENGGVVHEAGGEGQMHSGGTGQVTSRA